MNCKTKTRKAKKMKNKNTNKENKSYQFGFIIGGFIGKLFKPVYNAFKKWVM